MLVAQIAVSTVLLVCAALFAKTVIHLRAEPLGFRADGLEVAEVALPTTPFDSSAARNKFYEAFEDQLRARPGVRAVAAPTAPPLTGGAFITVRLSGDDNAVAPRMCPKCDTRLFRNRVHSSRCRPPLRSARHPRGASRGRAQRAGGNAIVR
jgi:hypothetical protein